MLDIILLILRLAVITLCSFLIIASIFIIKDTKEIFGITLGILGSVGLVFTIFDVFNLI